MLLSCKKMQCHVWNLGSFWKNLQDVVSLSHTHMSDNDNFAVPAPRKPARPATSTAEESSADTTVPVHSSPTTTTTTTTTTTSAEPPQAPPLAYEKPQWGAVASHDYGFEVLKGGISIEKIQGPKKDVITIGKVKVESHGTSLLTGFYRSIAFM